MSRNIKTVSLIVALLLYSSGIILSFEDNQQDSSAFKEILDLKKKGNFTKAIKELKLFTKKDSKNAFAHNLLGEIYIEVGGDGNIKNAEKAFKNALDIEPENSSYLLNYGNIELKRRRFDSAKRVYLKAISLENMLIKAHEGLLKVYFAENDQKSLNETEEKLKMNLHTDPAAPDIYFTLGKLYLENRNFRKSEEILTGLIKELPSYNRARLYIGDLYFEFSRYSTAAQYYLEGLNNINEEEELEKRFQFAKEIFSEEEKAIYNNLPTDEKCRFLRMFWKRKDPDPLTKNNERLIEHLKRVKFVKTVYTPNQFPSMDDRGRVYVKYGAPDSRYISASGYQGFSRGNESWVYNMIHKDLSFDFVDFGGIYKQVKDLKEAIVMIPDKYRELRLSVDLKLIASIDLYKERAHLGINYANLATDNIEEFLEKWYNFSVNREIAEIEAPPQRFEPEFPFEPGLDAAASFAQFRNDDGKTKFELYLGIYLKDSDFEKDQIDYKAEYSTHYALLNNDLDKEEELKRQYLSTIPDISFPENTISRYQENFVFKPGDKQLAFKIANRKSKRGGIFTLNLPLRDFSSTDLIISDIQFSENISQKEGKSPDIKNDLKITPYPYNIIRREAPIFIYFEIYNLSQDLSEKTYYKIEYILKQKEQSVNLISNNIVGFELEKDKAGVRDNAFISYGDKSTTIKYLKLDFSSIDKGRSQLIIKITDLNSGQIAETVKEFEIR